MSLDTSKSLAYSRPKGTVSDLCTQLGWGVEAEEGHSSKPRSILAKELIHFQRRLCPSGVEFPLDATHPIAKEYAEKFCEYDEGLSWEDRWFAKNAQAIEGGYPFLPDHREL